MTDLPRFGAGLWHFASYVDRYAVDGYAPPVTTLEAIARAGEVGDLSVVDLNYPFTPGVGLDEVKDALKDAGLEAIGITPEIYLRKFGKGAFTNPDPAIRSAALDVCTRRPASCASWGATTSRSGPARTAGTTRSRCTTATSGSWLSTACASSPRPTPT